MFECPWCRGKSTHQAFKGSREDVEAEGGEAPVVPVGVVGIEGVATQATAYGPGSFEFPASFIRIIVLE